MDLEPYFAEVHARRGTAEPMEFRDVSTEEWSPIPVDCHRNVDHFVGQHLGTRAVRGWVIMSEHELGAIFVAHSVVEDNGEVYDITPPESCGSLRFLRHTGTEEDFFAMLPQANYYIYPQPTSQQIHDANVSANLAASDDEFFVI